jgi:Mce-associated membrane protein
MSSDEQRPEPDEQENRVAADAGRDDGDQVDPHGDTTTDEPTGEATEATEKTEESDGSVEESASAEGREKRSPRQGPPRPVVFVAAALTVASLVVAVVFGVMWQSAEGSDDVRIAEAREAVVASAGSAVVAFTGLDSEAPDEYFRRQKELATGDLLKEIEATEQQYRDAISKAKTTVDARVADVAVEELNVHEGKAIALAVVELTVTQEQDTGTKTLRMQLQLERDRGDDSGDTSEQAWKVSGISPVEYGASG